MISLRMKLYAYNFGGAKSHGLGQMHPKLVTANLLSDFSHVHAHAAIAE